MCTVAPGMVDRLHSWALRRPGLPLALLAALCVLSLGLRVAWIGAPCYSPCASAGAHLVIFDEDYYVNAARVIAGIRPPAGVPYSHSPLGTDPNAEHPPLAKLIMAGSIELFGDDPPAWRLGSLVFGTIAILGMYALVRAARGSRWLALGASALMAADNLFLVHARIGTLDIYAVAAMVWGAALYLRRRPVLAGVVIGVGACAKEVAPYVLLVLILVEAVLWLTTRAELGARLARLGAGIAAAAGTFVGLMAALGPVAPPYADAEGRRVAGGVWGEISHVVSYAAHQTSPHGPQGIASYPWQWLYDLKPITYLSINPARPVVGLLNVHPEVHFLGFISPPILLFGLLGAIAALVTVVRRGRSGALVIDVLAPAWFLATFVPFVLASLLFARTSYLYYMLIVMPALYLAAAYLVARVRLPRAVTLLWVLSVLAAVVVLYPLTPIPL
jgi:predicted membrane-bound dolichyl-phosphate-mannose-protein mannosyltransferase